MNSFFKTIRGAIGSLIKLSKKEERSSTTSSSSKFKPSPRKNVKTVPLSNVPTSKKNVKTNQQHFRKRENAVSCEVPAQLMAKPASKKRVAGKKKRSNKANKVSEKKQ